MITGPAAIKDFYCERILRLGWFFKDQWRRYLVAISCRCWWPCLP